MTQPLLVELHANCLIHDPDRSRPIALLRSSPASSKVTPLYFSCICQGPFRDFYEDIGANSVQERIEDGASYTLVIFRISITSLERSLFDVSSCAMLVVLTRWYSPRGLTIGKE